MFPDPLGQQPRFVGNDYIIAGGGKDIVHGGGGNDRIFGGTGNDFLYGDAGNDDIHGDEGDDQIEADQPNVSLIIGGRGNDNVYGGDGFDVLLQTVDAPQTLTNTTLIGQGFDRWQNIEQIRLTGGAGDNTFDVSNFSGIAFMDGQGGNDRITTAGDVDATLYDDAIITNNRIHDQVAYFAAGISVASPGATVNGNELYGNGNNRDSGYGILVSGARSLITGNNVYGQSTGIRAMYDGARTQRIIVSGNQVHANARFGIEASGGVLVTRNQVYGQVVADAFGIADRGDAVEIAYNDVYNNDNGISVGTLAHNNRVYNNTRLGVRTGASGIVRSNVIYSNKVGIEDYFNGYYNNAQVINNLIYANSDAGIIVATLYSSGSPLIVSNTIYQPTGDAVRILAGSANVQLRNNILWAQNGYDILVPADSQVGFQSDYNLLFVTGNGKLGQWEGRDFTSRLDWFYELGLDEHSLSTDPLFEKPAGADGLLGVIQGVDYGQDDNFHLQSISPAIDAGHPADTFFNEPTPNGDRLNLGSYGNTPRATLSRAQTLQIVSPNGHEKFEVGQLVNVQWRSSGLTTSATTALINVGGPTTENWMADQYQVIKEQTGNIAEAIDLSGVAEPAPLAIYQSYAYVSGPPGGRLRYQLPVPDGNYSLRLHLVTPANTTRGSRVMNIQLQGQLVGEDYDLFVRAGGALKAVAESFFVTASGGGGVTLELMNKTYGGVVLAGIELTTINPLGMASPKVDLELSTDNGANWSVLATGMTLDRFGRGSYPWTAGPETAGNTGLFRVRAQSASRPQDVSDGGFLIANAGQNYYVNDNATTGDVLASRVGDNALSGKSPDRPMASLSALLAAYDLDPQDR